MATRDKETDGNKAEADARDKQPHVVDDAEASKDEETGHDDKAEALKGKEADGDDAEAGATNKLHSSSAGQYQKLATNIAKLHLGSLPKLQKANR